MNNWDNIIIGIQLAIIIQLLIVGVLNILQKNTEHVLLGIFCILIANSIIFYVNLTEIKQYKVLYFFIGGAKNVFYGPLLYLFLKSINQKGLKKVDFYHLLIPAIIYILSLYKYYFVSDLETKTFFTYLDLGTFSLLVLVYYIMGIREYKQNLQIKLKQQSKNRYLIFYYSTNGYLLISVTLLFGYYIFLDWGNNFYAFLSEYNHAKVHTYITIPVFLIFCFALFFYGLTELKFVKRFIPKQIIFEDLSISFNSTEIERKLDILLKEDKIFKDSNLTLGFLAHTSGVKQNIIRNYLKKIKDTTFTTYINSYRIADFKANLTKKEYQNYDLIGIALESGFKSRASFYRIFKEAEGMTPGDYKKSISNTSL